MNDIDAVAMRTVDQNTAVVFAKFKQIFLLDIRMKQDFVSAI
jgi:hypothetical protein